MCITQPLKQIFVRRGLLIPSGDEVSCGSVANPFLEDALQGEAQWMERREVHEELVGDLDIKIEIPKYHGSFMGDFFLDWSSKAKRICY